MISSGRKLVCLLLPVIIWHPQPVFGEPSLRLPCQSYQSQNEQNPSSSDSLTLSLGKAATWIEEPALGLDELLSYFAGNVRAYFTPSVWPNLNAKARQARVPVIMYHDIVPQKKVFFDVTPKEFENQLQSIQQKGLTPISANDLLIHLRTGLPLPQKPILLTFDDGYLGHYTHVYPLLKKYQYPALFSIYTNKLDKKIGRPGITWDQLREMAANPLVTIAAHSVTHPKDLTQLSDEQLEAEVRDSKQILEARLGTEIHFFTYPEGNYDRRVEAAAKQTGYWAAFTMNDADEGFAGQSSNLLSIKRFGQSSLPRILGQAWGGAELPKWRLGFDFSAPVQRVDAVANEVPFTLISGGRPMTIHAKSRYQVQDILAGTKAIAGVDGGFFSLQSLDSNIMIGPVLSQKTDPFTPGNASENRKLAGRPLVLISPFAADFVSFNPSKHNTLEGISAEMPMVTDAFVAAAWLVKNSEPQPPAAFGSLFDFDAARHRAFWGINQGGQPKIGVSAQPIGSVNLGKALAKLGFRDAVMLDSGASTSLAYKGESLVGYVPRPVPHVVSLVSPPAAPVPFPSPICMAGLNKT
jgi:poly-beta-1,6-N-acetyl-D-glucosamine N-deacetylase